MAEELFEHTTSFVEVLLPIPVPRLFTYRVPAVLNQNIQEGQRVIVQFGDRKVLTGVIIHIHQQAPKDYEAKYILDVLDDYPVITPIQLQLFQWIADYYLCSLGEVMNAALPSGLKLSSESMVQLNPAFNLEESEFLFSEKEIVLLKKLQNESLTYSDISKLLGVKNLYSLLKSLVSKEAVILFEEVREKYRPKKVSKIRLAASHAKPEALEALFEKLAKHPKQEAVILKYLQHVPAFQHQELNAQGILKNVLLDEEISESSLKTLIKNNILEEFQVVVSRFGEMEDTVLHPILLSEDQQRAQSEILQSFQSQQVVLLQGVTGSGKTEIYINLIRQAIEGGSQVLYLLPEIALTTQIVHRLKKVFGKSMGVYHSRFSDNERVEVWNGVISGRFKFIVGVRSSVLLPFDNLGLIIVDEEHDPSYKQYDPSPRYHARDVAMMLGKLQHAKVLLGSATPSIESYYHASIQKFGWVKLDKRFGDAKLPTILLADMHRERKMRVNKGQFSSLLLKNIEDTLIKKEQAIIFQNRRGYSPMVNCEDCEWKPKCVNCAVSLTYHQYKNELVCHYCGYKEALPNRCPSCTSARLNTKGYGTEKIEEELSLHFPSARIQRMDLDTTRSKGGYENIITQFEEGETDVLVGTQMVTKGLDFDRVSLVGIFNADRIIHFPDFRSFERAYQLITQVSGRAGRKDKSGTVIIQTSDPDHPILQRVIKNQQEQFYRVEVEDRYQHKYPPFTRLIEITIKHVDKKICLNGAQFYVEHLRNAAPDISVLGPGEPMISKIRNFYLMSVLIKIPRSNVDLKQIKQHIMKVADLTHQQSPYKSLKIVIDVDPV
jgi:primosomal protein N' (replication factor Y)